MIPNTYGRSRIGKSMEPEVDEWLSRAGGKAETGSDC
jgi:hypothetical protein